MKEPGKLAWNESCRLIFAVINERELGVGEFRCNFPLSAAVQTACQEEGQCCVLV